MSNTPSVTVHYAQAILQAAERLALPLPAELREPSREARIPLARQDELWEAFCAVAGDPLIGLRLGHALQVGHLDMVGAQIHRDDTPRPFLRLGHAGKEGHYHEQLAMPYTRGLHLSARSTTTQWRCRPRPSTSSVTSSPGRRKRGGF